MNLEHWWNDNSQEKTRYWEMKKKILCHCVHHIFYKDNGTASFWDSTS